MVLLVTALAAELPDQERLLTGVGKINATRVLTQRLTEGAKPQAVVNLGSAGGLGIPSLSFVRVNAFHQWDMRCEGLGFDRGVTPYDPAAAVLTPTYLPDVDLFNDVLVSAPCYTSDRFIDTEAAQPPGPCVVDMEAFALATVCRAFEVPFASIKFVTDGADGQAGGSWARALENCSSALSALADHMTQL